MDVFEKIKKSVIAEFKKYKPTTMLLNEAS